MKLFARTGLFQRVFTAIFARLTGTRPCPCGSHAPPDQAVVGSGSWCCCPWSCAPRPSTRETRTVRRGDNLQTVLNSAKPGDILLLEAGAEFVGNFILPVKTGDAPIVVRSRVQRRPAGHRSAHPAGPCAAARAAAVGEHGRRRSAPRPARITGICSISSSPPIRTASATSSRSATAGARRTRVAKVPHDLYLSHLYVHGDALQGQKRCVALNAAAVTIRDSHISDCKGVGNDTQAIGGWNGPGPYLIENNYLEAAGENVMFGGADPAIPNLVPDGITFRGNLFSRPMAWRDPIIPTPQVTGGGARRAAASPAGTYAYRVIARRPVGQGTTGRSTASAEVQVSVGDGGAVRVCRGRPIPDAADYRVYGRSAGAEDTLLDRHRHRVRRHRRGGHCGRRADHRRHGVVGEEHLRAEERAERGRRAQRVREPLEGIAGRLGDRPRRRATPVATAPGAWSSTCASSTTSCGTWRRGSTSSATTSPSRPTRQTNAIVIRNNLFEDVSTLVWRERLVHADGRRAARRRHRPQHGVAQRHRRSSSSMAARRPTRARCTTCGSPTMRRATRTTASTATTSATATASSTGSCRAAPSAATSSAAGRRRGIRRATSWPARSRRSSSDAARGDFRLTADSRLRGAATDGGDIGADIGSLAAADAAGRDDHDDDNRVEPGMTWSGTAWRAPTPRRRLRQPAGSQRR